MLTIFTVIGFNKWYVNEASKKIDDVKLETGKKIDDVKSILDLHKTDKKIDDIKSILDLHETGKKIINDVRILLEKNKNETDKKKKK